MPLKLTHWTFKFSDTHFCLILLLNSHFSDLLFKPQSLRYSWLLISSMGKAPKTLYPLFPIMQLHNLCVVDVYVFQISHPPVSIFLCYKLFPTHFIVISRDTRGHHKEQVFMFSVQFTPPPPLFLTMKSKLGDVCPHSVQSLTFWLKEHGVKKM